MFGPRITTVFKSRWRALWWSAGILATAYCSVPKADQAKRPDTPPQHHTNPWAKDSNS